MSGEPSISRGRQRPACATAHRGPAGSSRALALIIVVAVLLRAAVALWLGDDARPVSGAYDQVSYDALARRVLGGHGFSFAQPWYPFIEPDEPTAHWSYLYTLYLVAVYAVVGPHPLAARLIQVAASGAGCWLLFRLGRQLFDARVGLAAAALSAVYAYFVFFNAALMTQTFFILALLATMDRAVAIAERPRAGAWAGLGISLGAGALLRQTLLLFAPLLIAWLVVAAPDRRRWRHAALAAVIIAGCVLPWTAYNYVVFGDVLLLNSNGGYFFYAANHPQQGVEFNPVLAPPPPAALRGLGEPALDRALYRTGLGFIVAEPTRFLRLCRSRLGAYFQFLPSATSSPLSNAARLGSFTLYLPLMLYGLAISRQRWRACVPFYLYIAFDTLLHVTSWAAPRYRLPSDALLMVFAGLAVATLAARFAHPGQGR